VNLQDRGHKKGPAQAAPLLDDTGVAEFMTFTGWSDGTLGSATRPGSSLARNPPAHGLGEVR